MYVKTVFPDVDCIIDNCLLMLLNSYTHTGFSHVSLYSTLFIKWKANQSLNCFLNIPWIGPPSCSPALCFHLNQFSRTDQQNRCRLLVCNDQSVTVLANLLDIYFILHSLRIDCSPESSQNKTFLLFEWEK